MAITQSDAEPVVTTDDNSVRTPADSPMLAPTVPKDAVPLRLRKGKGKGRKAENLSRYVYLKLLLTVVAMRVVNLLQKERERKDDVGETMEPTKLMVPTGSLISVLPLNLSAQFPRRT